MTTLLIIICSAIFLGLALKNLRWAIFVLTAALPTYLLRFSIGPLPSTLLEIFVLITIFVWVAKGGYKNMEIESKTLIPIILFLVAGGISIFVSPNLWQSLGIFRAYILEPILIFFVITSTLKNSRDVQNIFKALGITALIISIYAIIERLTGWGIPTTWIAERRVTSFFPFPNAVGLFLGPLIPIFVGILVNSLKDYKSDKPWFSKIIFRTKPKNILPIIFWFSSAVLSTMAIIFSKTEGAWIGVLVALFFMGIAIKKTRVLTIIISAVAFAILIFVPQIRAPIAQKILFHDWSGHVRQTQWVETIKMLSDCPIFGTGLSGYPSVFRPYHRATYIEIFQYPHNIILNFWSELGLLGLIAFTWLVMIFFKKIYNLPQRDPLGSIFHSSLFAAMIVILIHGLVDVPYFKNDLAVMFWILMATATILDLKALPNHKKMIG